MAARFRRPDIFAIALLAAAFLVSLVSGLLLVFAIIVMPGLGTLEDRAFLLAFKVIDRVIQDNQPVFVLVWGGSILAVVVTGFLAVAQSDGSLRALVLAAAAVYLLGVQLSTFVFNIPLNNKLQTHDLDAMTSDELASARARFEPGWTTWNQRRTFFACLASLMLLAAMSMV